MPVDTAGCALGIFAKAPVPGRVKTRLAADVGTEAATQWYTRFLRVVCQRTADAWPALDRILFFDPPQAADAFDTIPAAPEHRVPQGAGDLGDRMARALHYCLDRGAARPVLIGTDAPTLPTAYIEDAWEALRHADVALGPARDGGYYLIGTSAPQPALFTDVAWSTDTVFQTTVDRAAGLGLHVHLLPEWFDVDTAADLDGLGPAWDSPEES